MIETVLPLGARFDVHHLRHAEPEPVLVAANIDLSAGDLELTLK